MDRQSSITGSRGGHLRGTPSSTDKTLDASLIEKYQQVYPTAIACLQRDLQACLNFYANPKEHWKTIRTTNVIERLFGEVKRRSHKMAAAFRNEGSCVLVFYAVIRSLRFNKLSMPASSIKQPDAEI
jgi:transposase-like protein